MAIATWPNDNKLGAVALKAAGAVTATGNETAVEVGKGAFKCVSNITAIDCDASDDLFIAVIEANTRNATSTWLEIGTLFARGNATATGRSTNDSTDEEEIIVDNPYDYQVRVKTYLPTTTTSGINYTVNAYPLPRKE